MLSEYGKILRKIRIDSGELLNDMAIKLDVSPALLSYIENGKREIPQDFTQKVLNYYKLGDNVKVQLKEGEIQNRKAIKMDFSLSDSMEKRKTAILFARTFNNISDDVLAKIRELLEDDDED